MNLVGLSHTDYLVSSTGHFYPQRHTNSWSQRQGWLRGEMHAGSWCHIFRAAGRGGVAGPAGLALAGPLFSGSLVSFVDCRDSLRTRRLGQVCHASWPLPCVYAFLVIIPPLLPADQEPSAASPDCIGTHVLLNAHAYMTCSF